MGCEQHGVTGEGRRKREEGVTGRTGRGEYGEGGRGGDGRCGENGVRAAWGDGRRKKEGAQKLMTPQHRYGSLAGRKCECGNYKAQVTPRAQVSKHRYTYTHSPNDR